MNTPTITKVYGATCAECGYHESLHTADRSEAERTARELGWRHTADGLLCPQCAPSKSAKRKGVAK